MALDLIGKKFNRLLVTEKTTTRKNGEVCWKCVCDCGAETLVRTSTLTSGNTKSCGCLLVEFGRSKAKPVTEVALNASMRDHRKSAAVRNLQFDLTEHEVKTLIFNRCHYCGTEPNREIVGALGSVQINGIDRVDNDVGYVTGNAVPCCTECNYAKRNMTHEKFMSWVKRLVEWQQR